MRILLMRHGPAVKSGPYADLDRSLTPRGAADVGRAARGLRRAGARPEALVTSPAQRCRETARLVAETLGLREARVKICDALSGGTPAPRLLEELATLRAPKVQEFLVVGHEPDLVALGSHLLSAEERVHLRFEPAGCACFELEGLPLARRASLLWLLTASQLAMLSEPQS
jgi:phosphohistidine phosphatase